ncbi:SubName: Full=Related to glycoside hydrolase family 16 protein-Laccaria bicolor {ECO:0000313/EMBL:CCA73334.1} [Serendipita indica DSM 11827]|nr:SubName: Full=Related to glycoside hydrolase family 16 protein-Laccaria bicolor {ECO:0000313/EMBL:CCA73334.1} [Serendipita indica DSM 11827]
MTSVLNLLFLAVTNSLLAQAQLPLYKSFVGKQFTEGFYFFDDRDPANGVVNYLSEPAAQSAGLVSWTDSTFTMKADSINNSVMGKGRDSVRLVSRDEFGDGVYIFDINHSPVGCGTWPAVWTTTTKNWPYGGEIDVLEGANANSNSSITTMRTLGLLDPSSLLATGGSLPGNASYSGQNAVSLHTAPQCPLKDRPAGSMTGTAGSMDCSGLSEGNIGCGVTVPGKSFGGAFNENGGGIYAVYRNIHNSSTIQAWFWPRDVTPPADVLNSSSTTVNPSTWGTPTAAFTFQYAGCGGQFHNHAIVLNIDFCGDYAEATYAANGCPGTCEAFVKYNPKAFTEAYFEFRSVRFYGSSALTSFARPSSVLFALFTLLSFLLAL